MSVIETVCERIIGSPQFASDYAAISHQSILANSRLPPSAPVNEKTLARLIQSAALFAQSSQPDWRQLAYRISVGSLPYTADLGGVAESARLILARLGNYPAIKFAFNEIAEPRTLTKSAYLEIIERKAGNTVRVGEQSTVLTDMQRAVWEIVTSGASLALSAPTSAGKSFVFLTYIEDVKHKSPAKGIVYLVPSRALISQVADSLRETTTGRSFGVSTVPIHDAASGTPIYVLTPERLQVLFYTAPNLLFDIAIVDEAHLIGEGSRGIILHSVLQELQRRKSDAQFLFSSPQVRDPSVFGNVVGNSSVQVIKTKDTPVAQNIILLNGSAQSNKSIDVDLWEAGARTRIATMESQIPIYNSSDRLIYFSWALGIGSQSLVYAEGPATCEDIALKIRDLGQDETVNPDALAPPEEAVNARQELCNFAKEIVHPTYVLAETALGGVGFHYGRIPTPLRNAIEDCFSLGYLDYIVCTSTLLQGVNLPARNIFMQNPHKGSELPIEAVDFWNLAGRAGRLGKDFQGNVFLIDYDEWESAPLAGPKDEPIKPSLETALTDLGSDFLNYMISNDRPSGETPIFESAFSKLLRDHKHNRLDDTLTQIATLSPTMKANVEDILKSIDKQISLPAETLDATPQVSGYRQQQLYEYMMKKIKEKGPDYLIPLHPSASWDDALQKLRPVFARVHKYLELRSGKHHLYWAPLALRWMRGDSLPLIIESAIKHHLSRGKRRSNRTVIREVLTDIESDLRFRYVNLLSCYTSVLQQALRDSGHTDHISKVPALTLYLELGAASKTMIQLMGLGLSRHTANAVAQLSVNKDMDAPAALAFLRRINPEAVGLSKYLSGEIARVISGL